MSVEAKRMTATKTSLVNISSGRFEKQEGFTPSYVLSKNGEKLSRVRNMATVIDRFVAEDKKYASATLDDGTGTIRMKTFKTVAPIADMAKGDIVDVISKVRSYNEEVYLMPENVNKIADNNFITLRKAELMKKQSVLEKKKQIILENRKNTSDFEELKSVMKKKFGITAEEVEAAILSEDIPKTDEEKDDTAKKDKEAVVSLLEKLDSGSGCDYATLIKEAGLPESAIEEIVNELLSDGTCFEPRPGILKLL
jgi:RPA family protein